MISVSSLSKLLAFQSSLVILLAWTAGSATVRAELPIPVSDISRSDPVDFSKEIMPLLKQNCLACHHEKESEGGLNLETHTSILAGGDSGPGVVPKDVASSLLMVRATGAEEPLMPPEDNSVGAVPLTPEQLGLLKLWIDQGASDSKTTDAPTIDWQPIPESIRTIYAMDVSADGRLVAVGRGNRAVVLDLQSKSEVGRLIDPELAAQSAGDVTGLDLVQSIAFAPEGDRIATGGYRTVRLWKKTFPEVSVSESALSSAAGLVAYNADQSAVALVNAIGDIEVRQTTDRTLTHTLATPVDRITGLTWSGNQVWVCDERGRLMAWDIATGGQIADVESGTPLCGLVTSRQGDAVAAITDQRQPVLWRIAAAESGKLKLDSLPWELDSEIRDATALAFADKPAAMLILARESVGVDWINLADGKTVRKIDHGSAVDALSVSPDGTKLATGGRDGKTRTWSLADGKPLVTCEGDPQERIRIARATTDADRQKEAVTRLDAKTAELEKTLETEKEALKKVAEQRDKAKEAFAAEEKKHNEAVARVTATQAAIAKADADSKQAETIVQTSTQTLASAKMLGEKLTTEMQSQTDALAKAKQAVAAAQQQIEAATRAMESAKVEADKLAEEVAKRKAAIAQSVQDAADAQRSIDEAKEKIAAAKSITEKSTKELETQKKAVAEAEAAKSKSESELKKRSQTLATADLAVQRAAAAIPTHKAVIAAATHRKSLLDQRLADMRERAADPANAIVGVAFSGDGNTIASAHRRGMMRVYRTTDGTPLSSHRSTQPATPAGLCFTGPQSVTVYGEVGRPSIWSLLPQWSLERKIGSVSDSPISDRVTALDFRPDGMTIAVGSGPPSRSGEVLIFSVTDGAPVREFREVHSDTVLGLKFSPDGRLLASSAADKTVRLLDIASGEVQRSLEGHSHHVLSLAWQDDGQTIASASADQNVKVWDVNTGEQRRTISGFPKEITAIAFVGRSDQIITTCADGQLRLHDSGNGKSVRTFNAGGDFLFALSVTPDSKTLIAGGQSGVVRVWTVDDGKLVHEWK